MDIPAPIRQPVPADEEIGSCYHFLAHERPQNDDATPFIVPSLESYACFYFEVPWRGEPQAILIRSHQTTLAHHFMLYSTMEPQSGGSIIRNAANCGVDVRVPLAVFGRGQQTDQVMPDGVGLILPPPEDHRLLLEVHYFNPGSAAPDEAGVEICTAAVARTRTATISSLGPLAFVLPPGATTDVTSSCTPTFAGDIHLFRSYPHMHARGIAMQVLLERQDAQQREVLLDVTYDAGDQLTYETPAVLRPGDRLLTTCRFANDSDHEIVSGFGAEDEMCNDFVYAWPAHALSYGAGGVAVPCLL